MATIGATKRAKMDRKRAEIVQRDRMKRIRRKIRQNQPAKHWFNKTEIAVNSLVDYDDDGPFEMFDDGA